VPGRNGSQLEEGATPAWIAVAELGAVLVPQHLEQILLDALVEPCAPEDELPQPVDKGLVPYERDPIPVADDVLAEVAAGIRDRPLRGELDEVGGLVRVELARLDQAELDGGGIHALFEVEPVEAEAVAQELDDEVVTGVVIGLGHAWSQDRPRFRIGAVRCRS
jgi:hypothetical protein